MSRAIQMRRNTAAGWTSNNTILLSGEIGFEKDTNKIKIGDGTTAWNSLDYLTGVGGGSSVHAGTATLASGTATVSADWVTPDAVVVALPQAAPGTAGTIIYADPADIVDATSFMLKSDDATDSRAVFWMATEPTEPAPDSLVLPDTFYISFSAKFAADEVSSLFTNGQSLNIFALNYDVPFTFTDSYFLQLASGAGDSDTLKYLYHEWDVAPDYPSGDGTVTIEADTFYTFDIKVQRSSDHQTCEITVRVGGVEISTLSQVATSPWEIVNIAVGNVAPTGGAFQINHSLDWFRIGSAAYGDSDLFAAEFGTDESPFDSVVFTPPDDVSFGSGLVTFSNAGGVGADFYLLKSTS